jgi:hypothetical protein
MYGIYLQAVGLGTGTPSIRDVRVGYKIGSRPRRIAQHVAEWLVSRDETTTPMSCCSAAVLLVPLVDGCVLRFMGTVHDEGAALALLSSSLPGPNFLNVFSWVQKCVGKISEKSFWLPLMVRCCHDRIVCSWPRYISAEIGCEEPIIGNNARRQYWFRLHW